MVLGSGIRGSKRHRIPDPDPQHCLEGSFLVVNLYGRFVFGIRDPRSGIRKNPFPDLGSWVKKAPDPGSKTLIKTAVLWLRNDILLLIRILPDSNLALDHSSKLR